MRMTKTPALFLISALPFAVQAANTEFSYGGYIKFDAAYSEYKDGDMAAAGLGRDFYVPSTIPTGAANGTESFDMHAKSSRFNLKAVTTLDNGEKLTSFIEMDFLGSAQGDERITNGYSPRLRHAFFSYNNLTVGQTWSTFMNVGALPETVDFVGVSEGTVFMRQPLVRYTMGNLQLALENPETTLNGSAAGNVTDDNTVPDVVARYNIKAGDHNFSVAALGRQLRTQNTTTGNSKDATGFGVNVAGMLQLGRNDLKFSVAHGQLGRYVGLSAAADAVATTVEINNKIKISGDIEATDVTAAFVAYRHFWTPQLRSTIAYSMLDADYGEKNTGLTEKSNSARINLMYSPSKEITYGVEYSHAKREMDSSLDASNNVVAGLDGSMNRLHFTARYTF
ncbi:MAG: porin [Bacterioplanes sp.]|nr:porin [Bacterioplanes sp.]